MYSNLHFFELLLFFISIGAGIFGSLLGLGGGILIVPTLTLLFGVNIRYAVGASIISVIATSSGAAAKYVKERMANMRVSMVLEVATTMGALLGVMLVPFLPTQFLYVIFSLLLFYSAISMFRTRQENSLSEVKNDYLAEKLKLSSSYSEKGKKIFYNVTRVPYGFSIMLGAGVISALLGIGSGVLKVPAMDQTMRLPLKVSSATSTFMLGVTAAASAGAYYMRGDIIPIIAAPVALGVLVGSSLGPKIMMKTSNERLRKIFVVVLLFIGIQMALKAFRMESQ